jgi:Family of unknown function (DUF5989)
MPVMDNIVGKFNIASELLGFFWQNKWWWLTPILVILCVFGFMAVFAQSSAIAPIIYTLF